MNIKTKFIKKSLKLKKTASASSSPKLTDVSSESDIDIKNMEGMEYLKTVKDNSVDLVLTDPPYIISRETGMNKHYNDVLENEKNGVEFVKTEDEWLAYKKKRKFKDDSKKDNYMKYGTIYGKKYCVQTNYGDWDNNFTMEMLDEFIGQYYKKLRKGGTLIMFFDIWKIGELKEIMESYNLTI